MSHNKQLAIIPLPTRIDYSGDIFRLKNQVTVGYTDPEAETVIPFLKNYFEKHGMEFKALHIDLSTNLNLIDIQVIYDSVGDSLSEAYTLDVTRSNCKLFASSKSGLFYGAQTLHQLILQSPKRKLVIPTMKITDSPRFSWRGMHLDVSRHFMPGEFIKKYIDNLAFLKMNTFHWHLVDDQGWRVEIKQFPGLTEKGAWRDSTWMGHDDNGSGRYDGIRYGGYYSQEEIKDIVTYASERFITIIPEIEIPGHSQAAIASYPELGCTTDTIGVMTKWGISPYIYNIDENTFTFLFRVLDEVMDMFPSPYIHIGGDEAIKDQWKSSKKIQKRMHHLGIKDEIELQSYFTGRIEEYIRSNGRNIIGWDEILEGGLPKSAAVMSWRGTQGGIEAARLGHKVVMAPTEYCYFDYYQSQDTAEPLAIGGYLPIEKVYSYNPVPDELTEQESNLILGVQGNVWTEYLDSPEKVEYMVFPRIFAMAEIQWTHTENKDFQNFIKRLKSLEVYMIENQINYAKHYYTDKK